MTNPVFKRLMGALCVPTLLIALVGCSGRPAATTAENQQAKENDAKEKLKSNYMNDPTLQAPGAARSPGGTGAMSSPGMTPGGGR